MEDNQHKLRYYIHHNSPIITDAELTEFDSIINFDNYKNNSQEYEYSGNFIITKDVAERDQTVTNMCCGIITKDVELNNGETIYFAFDYGH